MASEVTKARESMVNPINATGGGRQTPRLYGDVSAEKYPQRVSLGISTRDKTAQKDKAILDSVVGQMSDGMWENSRQMEKYWKGMTFGQNESGGVELRFASSYPERREKWLGGRNGRMYSWNDYKPSGFNGMGSKEVKDFFAKKIKQIVDAERKEYPSIGKFNDTNPSVLDFFHSGVRVADAYSLYKRLKGR